VELSRTGQHPLQGVLSSRDVELLSSLALLRSAESELLEGAVGNQVVRVETLAEGLGDGGEVVLLELIDRPVIGIILSTLNVVKELVNSERLSRQVRVGFEVVGVNLSFILPLDSLQVALVSLIDVHEALLLVIDFSFDLFVGFQTELIRGAGLTLSVIAQTVEGDFDLRGRCAR